MWTGSVFTRSGYGRFKASGRDTCAHIFAWEMERGAAPEDLELDHLCHNVDPDCSGGVTCQHRRCVRPGHLELVTHQVNELRGKTVVAANARKEECQRGHSLSGANLFMRRNGSRNCRACRNAWQRSFTKRPEQRQRHATQERKRRARKREVAA